ncbi:MAG: hypothetical protein L0Y54_07275 [Sporichthyaceae bacterium]|nr:hypothetical protein [Sporichthyaceae bacterium]
MRRRTALDLVRRRRRPGRWRRTFSAGSPPGVPFPQVPLGVSVAIYVFGSWIDITSDVFGEGRADIQVTRGRANEAGQVEASRCTMEINNRLGVYSPRNPLSWLYGQLGRNTPIRVTLPGDDRFYGEVPSWPQRWDRTGTDVWVPIEAAGVMRRLGQGATPLYSAPRRYLPTTSPVAYWPMNDGQLAGYGAPVVGDQPFTLVIANPPVKLGTGTLAPWLDPAVAVPGAAVLAGGGVAMNSATTDWAVEFIYAGPDLGTWVLETISSSQTWQLDFRPGTQDVQYTHTVGGGAPSVFTSGAGVEDAFDGQVHHVRFRVTQDGADVDYSLVLDGAEVDSGTRTTVTNDGPAKVRIWYVPVSGDGVFSFGHVAVWGDADGGIPTGAETADAAFGHPGEPAGRRIQRLCAEEGIGFAGRGDLDDTAHLGPQGPSTLLDLLREAATTDAGVLHEPRQLLGLAYRTRSSMYNQTPALELTYTDGVFGTPPEPVDDDQATRNDVTATRKDGGSYRAVLQTGPLSVQPPPNGVGRYDTDVPVNTAGDGTLLANLAGWRLHLGTVDESRYPQMHLHLHNASFAGDPALTAAAAALDIGDRVTVDDLPAWLPPDEVTQLAQGFREVLSNFTRDIWVNCAPESPYQVAQYDAGEGGPNRYDTAGSSLAAAFGAGTDTSMSVRVDVLPLWTTDSGEFPFDIACGGARLQVTAISGAGSPQTFTITQTPVNGVAKTIPAGTPVSLWNKAVYAL